MPEPLNWCRNLYGEENKSLSRLESLPLHVKATQDIDSKRLGKSLKEFALVFFSSLTMYEIHKQWQIYRKK